MTIAASLFEGPTEPVLSVAAGWVTGTLFGTLATVLCVLAVAFVGLALMSGRLALRDALRVAIGCFVLLGASTIAAGLRTMADEAVSSSPTLPEQTQ